MSINVTDLTEVSLDGNGVFDVLMRATVAHLQEEFKTGRITGANYTNVYLNGLQAVLQQSVAYTLQKQQSDKQIELITAQIALQEAQALQVAAETSKSAKEEALLDEQILRAVQETAVSTNRVRTEQAKTYDTIDGVEVGGSVGKQIKLYQAQTDGFKRDAEQKAAKIAIDAWSTAKATDTSGEFGLPTEFEAANPSAVKTGIDDIIITLKEGIDVPSVNEPEA